MKASTFINDKNVSESIKKNEKKSRTVSMINGCTNIVVSFGAILTFKGIFTPLEHVLNTSSLFLRHQFLFGTFQTKKVSTDKLSRNEIMQGSN